MNISLLMMVLRLHLVCLAIFVLPETLIGRASGNNFFVPVLRWYHYDFNQVQVRWNVGEMKRAHVEEISVTAKLANDSTLIVTKNVSVNNGQVKIDGLSPYTLYIMAVDGFKGQTTAFSFQRFLRTWPTAPSEVQPPNGKAISAKQIQLQWSPPAHPNGILKPYILTCSSNIQGRDPISVSTKDNLTTSITVGGLSPSTEYVCYVTASTIAGTGQNPKECEKKSQPSAPIRTEAPSEVQPPTGKAISAKQIQLQWSPPAHPNGILKPYILTCSSNIQGRDPISVSTKDNLTTSITVEGLSPSTEYVCYVTASTVAGTGQNPKECEKKSQPSAPIRTEDRKLVVPNLQWQHLAFNEVLVKWDVEEMQKEQVEEIGLTAKLTNDSTPIKTTNVSVNNGQVKIDGLNANTLYIMIVEGYDREDRIFNIEHHFLTWPTAPSEVQPPTGKAISAKQIQLQWSPPAHPNGILKPYILTCSSNIQGRDPISVSTKDNLTTSITVGEWVTTTAIMTSGSSLVSSAFAFVLACMLAPPA
ncbi:unnamed protein product [Hydatigera taeniaeformis]|uniref:Protein-tyrosine-phosphatase n=1 Tax=Hydatigena taeniaeformis TaxID=6205 RepID=A0A0R3X6D5_HYDTA|nr:unnamed protein product [Hydatigera taeniaeformis]